ncbi:MAG: hypothetical protein AAGC61_08785, partial [Microbacterium sp.]
AQRPDGVRFVSLRSLNDHDRNVTAFRLAPLAQRPDGVRFDSLRSLNDPGIGAAAERSTPN